MTIRILPQTIINRIAAGEVVERPASVVKELVENSIDADAKNIEIIIENGGKNLISIKDDGKGMDKDELALAIKRHATSKLDDDDLFNIKHFGFRGEALPSIASISRMKIASIKQGESDAFEINIEGGEEGSIKPSRLNKGTLIEIRDLFYATPARLKFLKTDRVEKSRITETIEKISLANPEINFTLISDGKKILDFNNKTILNTNPLENRIEQLLGTDFLKNSIQVESQRNNSVISGYIGLPTYNAGNSLKQFLFVNGRPVKDKVLLSALRVGYMDYLAKDRFPIAAIFLEIPAHEVDVNVHPAKSEVRFRFEQEVRGMIIGTIKNLLAQNTQKTSTTISDSVVKLFKADSENQISYNNSNNELPDYNNINSEKASPSLREANKENLFTPQSLPPRSKVLEDNYANVAHKYNTENTSAEAQPVNTAEVIEKQEQEKVQKHFPLGFAKAHLHENYIVSQTEEGLILVDAHAAHERITYEKLKVQYEERGVRSLKLLLPEIIELTEDGLDKLLDKKNELAKLGLVFDKFGNNAISVTEVPEILEKQSIKKLIQDIIDDIIEHGEEISLSEKIEHVLETFACHTSVRTGRKLNIEEMNSLLREMEKTPASGQCNHGRPTYIKLELKDIERLFGRS